MRNRCTAAIVNLLLTVLCIGCGEHEYSITLQNSFALPKNNLTSQLGSIDTLRSKGTINVPKGRVNVRFPDQEVASVPVKLGSLQVVFKRNTEVQHDISFRLVPIDGQDESDSNTQFNVAADIDTFQFQFSPPIEVQYDNKPIGTLAELSISPTDLEAQPSATESPAAEPGQASAS